MDLSKSQRVHVTSVTPGFLEVVRYLNSHMAVYDFIKQDQTSQCIGFQGIANLGHQAYLRCSHTGSSCF